MTSAAPTGPGGTQGDLPATTDAVARADSCGVTAVAPATTSTSGRAEPLGGDPACWLNRVCDECGRFVEDDEALTCPACGTPR